MKLWNVSSGTYLHTLNGHDDGVYSLSFSPTGETLASGSHDSTVKFWDTSNGELIRTTISLPNDEWVSWLPELSRYVSSLQGDKYFGLRFGSALRPVYPLTYYRDELQVQSLEVVEQGVKASIDPRIWQLRWENMTNKSLWAFTLSFFIIPAFVLYFFLKKNADPMNTASLFFKETEWANMNSRSDDWLILNNSTRKASVWRWQDDQLTGHDAAKIVSARVKNMLIEKLYILYKDNQIPSDTLYQLKASLKTDVIPLSTRLLEQALQAGNCKRILDELEEPYIARSDPYSESKPIRDPTWFFGRDALLDDLPAALAQGQHVCLLGCVR